MSFCICIRVWGGVTDAGESLLQGSDGTPLEFETRAEAENQRLAYLRQRNVPNGRAHLEAWIVERTAFSEWAAHVIADAAIRKARKSSLKGS